MGPEIRGSHFCSGTAPRGHATDLARVPHPPRPPQTTNQNGQARSRPLAAPAVAFVAPGQQAASKVVVKGDIGVDPGRSPRGLLFEDTEGLARARRRDQARPHLHDGVPRHDGPGARHHLPRLHDPRRLGPVLGHPQGRHGLRGARQRAHVRPRQIILFGGIAETVAMPASQYTGGPQNLPGGYDDRRARSPAAAKPERIRTPPRARALHVRAPERPRRHDGHVRRHVPLRVDSARPPRNLPIAHNVCRRRPEDQRTPGLGAARTLVRISLPNLTAFCLAPPSSFADCC